MGKTKKKKGTIQVNKPLSLYKICDSGQSYHIAAYSLETALACFHRQFPFSEVYKVELANAIDLIDSQVFEAWKG